MLLRLPNFAFELRQEKEQGEAFKTQAGQHHGDEQPFASLGNAVDRGDAATEKHFTKVNTIPTTNQQPDYAESQSWSAIDEQ